MTVIESDSPMLLALLLVCGGLIMGSFLNLVALRLPVMRKRDWAKQAQAVLAEYGPPPEEEGAAFNLSRPGSHCPKCGHRLRPLENIPLVSYLLLRGRCGSCKASISPRYPLVELVTGLLTLLVILKFGLTFTGLAAVLLSWCLLTLALIDMKTFLLPDELTLPLLWAGLLANSMQLFTDLHSAVLGAAGGYLVLWCVYQGFRLVTGREGMGFGDFKLLAALGAWLGWQLLLPLVMLASISGIVYALLRRLAGVSLAQALPFGPFLALAGWVALMYGDYILVWYQLG